MPSASPEDRRKNKEKRSRNKERSRSPAPDRRTAETYKKRKSEQERGTSTQDHRHGRNKDEDRGGRGTSRRANDDRSREERPSSSRHPRENNIDRSRRARENVRIKQEPTSEDEEERRRRRFERRTTSNRRSGEREDREFRRRPERVEVKRERGSGEIKKEDEEEKPKEKVNFGLSGKLTEDTNVFNGVVIKYNEPTEARKPNKRWRLYPFKGEEPLPILPIHRQSAYLLGRERKIADIPIDHPSCSKQHAAIQFRAMQYEREDGRIGKRIRPYIIDLDSANGTYVNNARIESRRYVELMEKDVVKFGFSSREYVLLHEGSVAGEDEVAPEDDPPENAEET